MNLPESTHNPTPIGIDLGTTHSLVATVANGRAKVLEGPQGDVLVPSVVHYGSDGKIWVGQRARMMAMREPGHTVFSVKRFMGRNAYDPVVEETLALPVELPTQAQEAQCVRFRLGERIVTPVEVSSEILRSLRATAEAELGPVGPVVVTVPAHFDELQRQATRDAARCAGFEKPRLLCEPTAAALAYGLESSRRGRYLIYDLGGGTFDVTVLELSDGVFQVKSTAGDVALGGDDVDRCIVEFWLAARSDETMAERPEELRGLLEVARRLKERLSEEEAVSETLEAPLAGLREVSLDRATLDAMVLPLVERTCQIVRRAFRDAKIDEDNLDGVLMVGGSTRLLAIREATRALFRREPLLGIDPERVVAEGAALRAASLARGDKALMLMDVLPLSLGIETLGGAVERILPRNSPIPTAARATFTTHVDGQTGFVIHVVQGERPVAKECLSLATLRVGELLPEPAGRAKLDISFEVDDDGLLRVTAREKRSGQMKAVEVSCSRGLDRDTVDALVAQAEAHTEADTEAHALAEVRIHGDSILLHTERILETDGDLLSEAEKKSVLASLRRLRLGLEHLKRSFLLELLIEELHALTNDLQERRLHRAVVEAVTGMDLKKPSEPPRAG